MTPEHVIAFKFSCDGLSLTLACLRFFVTRTKSRTKQNMASHIFLFLTFAADLVGTSVFAWIMIQERRLLNKYPNDITTVNEQATRPIYSKVFYIAHMSYFISLYLLKAAYLSFYAQLFIKTDTKRQIMLYAGVFVCAACFICGLCILLFFCMPFDQNWKPTTNIQCPVLFNFGAFAAIASMNIVSDVAIILIPFVVVSVLQLEKRERIGLAAVFVVGGSSVVASIARFVVIGNRILNQAFTWDTFHIYATVSHAEVFFGIIAFCLPTFRLLFVRALGRFISREGGGSSGGRRSRTNGSYLEFESHGMRNMGRKEPGVLEIPSPPDSQVDLTAYVNNHHPGTLNQSHHGSDTSFEVRPTPRDEGAIGQW